MSETNGSILGSPNLALINSITQFIGGTQGIWNTITAPVPQGMVVYAIDTTALKLGDGQTLYANLPVLFYLNSITSIAQQIASLTQQLAGTLSSTQISQDIATATINLLHQTVNLRTPTPTDDAAHAYNNGAFWNSPTGPYILERNTAGKAMWLQQASIASALPLDLVPGAIGAYGTQKLKSSYTGNAIQVTRVSDGTVLNIGFVNHALDTATLDAFLTGTTGVITIWYDQSGYGHNITAALSTGPKIDAFNKIGNSRAILFDNTWDGTETAPESFMTIPSTVTATFDTSAAVVLARTRNSQRAVPLFQWTDATSSIMLGRVPNSTFTLGVDITGVGQFGNTNAFMTDTPYVAGYNSSNVNFQVWKDDNMYGTGSGTGNGSQLTGGFLCSAPAFNQLSGYNEMAAVIFYSQYLTTTQIQQLTASLHWNFGTVPQSRSNLVTDGDSITDGYGSTLLQNYVRQAEPLIKKPMTIFNVGYFGDTLASRAVHFSSDVAPAFVPGAADNIVSIFAGTNDIVNGANLATLQTDMQQYCTLAHTTGFKVLVATILPRSGFSTQFESLRQEFNTWLGLTWSTFADGLIDFNGDPTMGGLESVAANTMYYVDGTHPTTLGYSYLAPIFANAVNALLTP